jgi:hypothetical protein
MSNENKNEDKSTWVIGGGMILGTGIGFFFIETTPMAFVGCILSGLGLGLIVTSIMSTCRKD